MRYQKPFTLAHRQQAIAVCRSLNTQLHTIKKRFPPRTMEQRQIARELRRTLQDLIEALRVPDGKVDVGLINELRERADYLGLQYAILQRRSSESRHDT